MTFGVSTRYITGAVGSSAFGGSTPVFGGSASSTFYNTDYLDSRYEYEHTKEGYEIEEAGLDASISKQLSIFQNYIESHREDEALDAYHKLIEVMKSQTRYANLDDETLTAIAGEVMASYLSEQTGKDVDLAKYIKDNSASASHRSWQKTFWNNSKVDTTTEEDLLNEICGYSEDKHVSGGQYVLEVLATPVKIFTELGDWIFGPKHH